MQGLSFCLNPIGYSSFTKLPDLDTRLLIPARVRVFQETENPALRIKVKAPHFWKNFSSDRSRCI